jgi:two-component system, cell cycle response regulator
MDQTVLVAEDDIEMRTTLKKMVASWGYDVIAVDHGLDAWQVLLQEDAPRLTILDWLLPGIEGVEICRRLRTNQSLPYTYVILLSVQNELESMSEGLFAGADDTIAKPVSPKELQGRLMAGKRIIDIQAELISVQETLRVQATKDPVTGAWNRSAIIDLLNRELERGRRASHPVSLMMVDLDHFKRVNDVYGHLAGDSVLSEIVQRLESSVRAYDFVGRYGGDEFLIVLPDCSRSASLGLADRVRASLETRQGKILKLGLSITASVGVTTFSGRVPVDILELIHEADEALLRAKNQGRNRVETSIVMRPE